MPGPLTPEIVLLRMLMRAEADIPFVPPLITQLAIVPFALPEIPIPVLLETVHRSISPKPPPDIPWAFETLEHWLMTHLLLEVIPVPEFPSAVQLRMTLSWLRLIPVEPLPEETQS